MGKQSKVSNVFNVGNHIRGQTKLHVSPSFIDEMTGYMKCLVDERLFESLQIAKSQGMKTLQGKHLIRACDFITPNRHRVVSCGECGRSWVVSADDKDRKMSCPFCHKKRKIIVEGVNDG